MAVQHAELGLLQRASEGIKTALMIEPDLELARFQLGLLLLFDNNEPVEAKGYLDRLRTSRNRALRAFAEAMISICDNEPTLARQKLAVGLSESSPDSPLALLMRRLFECLLSSPDEQAPIDGHGLTRRARSRPVRRPCPDSHQQIAILDAPDVWSGAQYPIYPVEMLLRSLPDLAQSNAEFQSWFQSKWGRENCLVWGRTRHAEFGPCTHTLSIRAAWGGVEHCHVNGRTLAVDDDNFLILNHGQIFSTSIRAMQPVESLAICFKPELAEQIYAEASDSIEQALVRGDAPAERSPDFMENLHPHDNTVSPVLRFIRMHISRGVVDEAWYDEQLVFLLARMQSHHQRLLEQVDRIALIRPSTRREVHRRISLVTDFMHAHYAQDIDLSTLAKMGYLSKYHFLRLFSLVHGMTPRTYLQRKRISVAIRLLESTRMTMSEVAASVGFAEESTLVRQMRRWTQMTPRQVRARVLAGRAA